MSITILGISMRGDLMKTYRQFSLQCVLALVFLAFSGLFHQTTCAATLFESGTLGPTGVALQDIGDVVPGTNVTSFVFTGVRFELTAPVITSQVGGHFAGNGTLFGAVVELDDADDFPNSGDFTSPDLRGSALLTFTNPSAEVVGDLALALDPGWYALVFGSGLFGATGSGAALRNGADIDAPSYIAFQPMSGVNWVDITSSFNDHRFVLYGTVVPEPNSIFGLMLPCLFVASLAHQANHRNRPL